MLQTSSNVVCFCPCLYPAECICFLINFGHLWTYITFAFSIFFFHYKINLFVFQFVPFRDYTDSTGNHILSMARLAKDVLAEVPGQFLSYMRTQGIEPLPVPPPYTPPAQPLETQIWRRRWQCSRKKTARIIFNVHRICCVQNVSPESCQHVSSSGSVTVFSCVKRVMGGMAAGARW